MEKIRRQNRLMMIGAVILLGALVIWSLGVEIYARHAVKTGVIDEDITLITFDLDNTELNLEGTDGENLSYSLTRSKNLEYKMYGKELRVAARGGILSVSIPDDMELSSINITNRKESSSIYNVEADEMKIETDGDVTLENVEAERAKMSFQKGDITSSEYGTLLVKATDSVELTETDVDDLKLFLQSQDGTILGGKIKNITCTSTEGTLDVEPDNGIFSITVTGGASTIFLDGDDLGTQNYTNSDNPDGTRIEFTSPKGSVKAC